MEQVILVAQKLAKEGKTPTTALVKSRLPKNTPLAAIIQGLKLWKASPEQDVETPLKENEPSTEAVGIIGSIDTIINELVDAKINAITAPLRQEIIQLNEQLSALKLDVEGIHNRIKLNNKA